MIDAPVADIQQTIADVYRDESRRIFATLIRLLGDFDLAEDALHDAFAAAMKQWPRDGVPANPRAWLVSTGRFKAIDGIRRRARFDASLGALAEQMETETVEELALDDEGLEDDRLRLIFTCCHPALAPEARVALTLREICGLTTEEIARAFLTAPPTLAQRIVRAKAKIRDAGIPYQVPGPAELPERLDTVLQVVYLVFNEGYSASSGDSLTRADLSGEAIRLARLLHGLLPEPEVAGLLALMLLHESRRAARTTRDGDLILLEDQDRSRWNRDADRGGDRAGRGRARLRAASARTRCRRRSPRSTPRQPTSPPPTGRRSWRCTTCCMQMTPSPIVELNRAVAVAMRDGPAAGLALVDAILERGDLADYHLAHSARADLCRRLGRVEEARPSYERALELTQQGPEQRFLERRLRELASA